MIEDNNSSTPLIWESYTLSLQVDEAGRIQRVIQKHIFAQYRHLLTWESIREHLITGTPLFAALVAPVSTVRVLVGNTEYTMLHAYCWMSC